MATRVTCTAAPAQRINEPPQTPKKVGWIYEIGLIQLARATRSAGRPLLARHGQRTGQAEPRCCRPVPLSNRKGRWRRRVRKGKANDSPKRGLSWSCTTPHLCGHCICAHVSGFFVGTNWGSPAGAWPSCARPSEIGDTGLPVSRAHSRAWRGKVSISGASPHSMPSSTRLNSDPHTPTKQVLVVSSKTDGGGGIETGKLYAMKAMSKKVNSAVNALGWCG